MSRRWLRVGVCLAIVGVTLTAAPAVAAATFTVNTNDDLDGTCTAFHCSLRQAINSANASPGHDLIAFNIGLGGPQSIAVIGTDLPPVTDPVTIDGTTQPGYSGTPIIELNGAAAVVGQVAQPSGLWLLDADGNIIRGLVINRFAAQVESSGITIYRSSNNVIVGNYIGTDLTGSIALPNDVGIRISYRAANNQIGGTQPADRNVISGNRGRGVLARLEGATGNVIIGNFIGTNAAGTAAIAQQTAGVELETPGNVVGRPIAGARNVISGNSLGVAIYSDPVIEGVFATDNVVQGNYIGTDVSGTLPIPNVSGVGLNAPRNLVGGIENGAGNLISGNASAGVQVSTGGDENTIVDNTIGVGADGGQLGNSYGLLFSLGASSNSIESNVIAFNTINGVFIESGVENAILSNSIFANGSLGIDLNPHGPTPNDPGDADTGANELQNFPVLQSATAGGGGTKVEGVLNSHPNTTYRLQFFRNLTCDFLLHGEGETLIGDRDVTTDATGTATFSFTFGGGQAGDVITSTATDPLGNTSEFSNCAQAVPAVVAASTTLAPPAAVNVVGTSHTVTATVTAVGTSAAGVTVRFTVVGSVQTSGQCTTDQSGQCSFTYEGPALPGADLITAFADLDGDGTEDPNELPGAATKAWILPSSTPGHVTGGGQTTNMTLSGEIAFGFDAFNRDGRLQGHGNVVDRMSGTHIDCVDVTALVQTGTHATFFGNALINGVPTTYRIDVDDLAEPGTGRDTFRIRTATGYVAGTLLTAGNVQIHG